MTPDLALARLIADGLAAAAEKRRERVAPMAQSPERVVQGRIAGDLEGLARDVREAATPRSPTTGG